MPHHDEPARRTPIVERPAVVVAGAGPAGVAAAIAAAKAQRVLGERASVRLIEQHGQLGGVWTTGLLSWILDAGDKHGVMEQVLDRLRRRGAVGHQGRAYDPEAMKLVLEQACVEAGVDVRLHTRVVAASVDEGRRINAVITESKSGREAFIPQVCIDCTGDGDLAAQAGCGFDFGRPAEGPGAAGADRAGETQPFTLMALITGIDAEATEDCWERNDRPWAAPKDALLAEFRRAGVDPSYARPTIFKISDDLYAWMINHQYGGSGIIADDLTAHTVAARAELHTNIDALRSLGGRWAGLRIVATGAQIGVREGRRVRGRYRVTVDDMIEAARHDDAVCRVTFGIDVHSTGGGDKGIEQQAEKKRTRPYDIPYRALVAADVSNLLLAGRCISGDFLAHSSYRVTGNAAAMGEAAGVAAACCAHHGKNPADLDWATASPVRRAIWDESAAVAG